MKYCRRCGSELDDNAKFCKKCGAMAEQPQEIDNVKDVNCEKIKSGKKAAKIVVTVGIAVVAVGAVWFGMKWLKNKEESSYEVVYRMVQRERPITSETFEIETYVYDEDGNYIEKKVYTSEDGLYEKYGYEYDKNGECTHVWESQADNWEEQYTMSFENEYEVNGRCISRRLVGDETVTLIEYTYDENGNCIYADFYENGKWESSYIFVYDEQQKCISVECCDMIEDYSTKNVYTYNENGDCIESESYYIDGGEKELYAYTNYVNDENGNCIAKQTYYINNGYYTLNIYTYEAVKIKKSGNLNGINKDLNWQLVEYMDLLTF